VKQEIACRCEHRLVVDLPETLDLASDPASEEQILDGSFMSVRCPVCGSLIKPELPFRVIDAARGVDIYHVPTLDRDRYLAGRLETVPKNVGRVVIGFAELVEKLRITNAGLDDRVVEVVKYHLMRRAGQEGQGVAIRFAARAEGHLVFEVHGLRSGEVGRVRVPEEKAARIGADLTANLRREPYRSFLLGPYVSCSSVTEDTEAEIGQT
jgi:hypothetical protein